MDVDRAPQTAMRFGVLSVPTVLLFKDGAVKDHSIGLLSKKALQDKIEKVL